MSECVRELFSCIANTNTKHHKLIESDVSNGLVVTQLLILLKICDSEKDMQLQILKTLSVLSEKESCNCVMLDNICDLGFMLKDQSENFRNSKKGMIFICRLGYIIGNILAQYDPARVLLYENNIVMNAVIETLDFYGNGKFNDTPNLVINRVDVLVKLIRVIANLCVNPNVGLNLGYSSLGVILLKILLQVKNSKVNIVQNDK